MIRRKWFFVLNRLTVSQIVHFISFIHWDATALLSHQYHLLHHTEAVLRRQRFKWHASAPVLGVCLPVLSYPLFFCCYLCLPLPSFSPVNPAPVKIPIDIHPAATNNGSLPPHHHGQDPAPIISDWPSTARSRNYARATSSLNSSAAGLGCLCRASTARIGQLDTRATVSLLGFAQRCLDRDLVAMSTDFWEHEIWKASKSSL